MFVLDQSEPLWVKELKTLAPRVILTEMSKWIINKVDTYRFFYKLTLNIDLHAVKRRKHRNPYFKSYRYLKKIWNFAKKFNFWNKYSQLMKNSKKTYSFYTFAISLVNINRTISFLKILLKKLLYLENGPF